MEGFSVRLLICAGGTGGGVYPALTVLEALKLEFANSGIAEIQNLETLWVGGIGGIEADLVKRKNVAFQAIPAAGVHGVGMRALPANIWRLSQGYRASRRILDSFRPDVMLFTGGYVAVPMALAAQGFGRKKTASVLYVPDIEPGLALKTLARFADQIMLTTTDSRQYFSNDARLTVIGYPVRQELLSWSRDQAFEALNLEKGLPVLLVLGGSTGALSINRALVSALPELLHTMQIVHITGQRNWDEVKETTKNLVPELSGRYHAYAYLHDEMGAALCAADLVLSRAGASCLGEYPMFGLPAILVPYPHAWRYQQINAEYLSSQGAALIVTDAELATRLSGVIKELFENPIELERMRSAMKRLARPQAAQQIAGVLSNLAQSAISNRTQRSKS